MRRQDVPRLFRGLCKNCAERFILSSPHPKMSASNIPVITIDGPTASGKGTVAHRVAEYMGFHYLDSGALYRLTALSALRSGTPLIDEHALAKLAGSLLCSFSGDKIFLDHENVTDA